MPVILSQQVGGSQPAPHASSPRSTAVARSLWTLWAAAAAWLSCGAIGFTSPGGTRLGLLPASAVTIALVAAAAIAVALLLRAGAPRAPLSLLGLTVLPWLPVHVPAAFLIWSGPVAAFVWMAVGVMLFLSITRDTRTAPQPDSPGDRGQRSNRDFTPLKAGALAFLLFAAAAWRAAPFVPGGDEPHYLVITQSVLLDGDLRIENNHRRGDYRAFYTGDLPPHFQRRGRDGEIYSIHAPGLPVLVLPVFALAGYPGVVVFLLLAAAAGSALAWHVAWLAARRADAAWFGWAAVTLPVTAVFHSFTVYPDGVGGVLALTGVWALLRAEEEQRTGSERSAPWLWHGVALAVLPWLHSRFAVIAGSLGVLILLRLAATRRPAAKAVAFLSVPAVSAMLWLGFFTAIYGRPDPAAPYGAGEMGSLQWIPGGLAGLMFDQRFGLLPYAPVLAFALAGVALMSARKDSRRLALELLFVMLPYLLTVTHFAMWWGGWSAPARFFVPVLPLLALPAAMFWMAGRRAGRTAALAALVFTIVATAAVVTVDRGRLAFNVRDTPALWLEWLSRAADLPQALPWWTRGGDAPFFRDIAIWSAAAVAALLGVRAAGRMDVGRSLTAHRVALAWMLALAVMAASTVVWTARGVDGRNVAGAQLQLLRAVASHQRALAVDLGRVRRIPSADVPRRIRIELTRQLAGPRSAGRDDRPLFDVPRVPAGEYRLTPVAQSPRGWLMIGVGRDQFSLRTVPLAAASPPIDLRLPVTVRGIVVRGDEDARQNVGGLTIEPVSLIPPGEWHSQMARRAVKYARSTVFFLDESSFPEPDAFWAGGGRSSSFVVQPDDARSAVQVVMRNGPVANRIVMDAGGERKEMDLAPGEERPLSLPVDPSRAAALVKLEVRGGFRPSDHDAASRDGRFLGVWIKVE